MNFSDFECIELKKKRKQNSNYLYQSFLWPCCHKNLGTIIVLGPEYNQSKFWLWCFEHTFCTQSTELSFLAEGPVCQD